MKEKPHSLENQLKMARPRRGEVKRVPLTPEEKEFLGEIMDKAVAAEKAGKLQRALNLYTDYKNELLKIKEKKEKKEERIGKEWNKDDVIEWAERDVFDLKPEEASNWVDENIEFDELPAIKTKSDLDLAGNYTYETLPNNLYVQGEFALDWVTINKMPKILVVESNLLLNGAIINEMPAGLRVGGNLHLGGTEIKNKKIPENIFVKGNVYIMTNEDEQIKEQLYKLEEQGKIKGNIIEQTSTE